VPNGSLLPTQLHPALAIPPPTVLPGLDRADSLTREKKGKMPALSHLLSVGKGRVLSLAADAKYVYAGCQSAENEIVVCPLSVYQTAAYAEVFSRSSLQPMFRLLGHQGSVLELMVVEEKQWLVSSSSAGDIRVRRCDYTTANPLELIGRYGAPIPFSRYTSFTHATIPPETSTLWHGTTAKEGLCISVSWRCPSIFNS
jgi:hypothetical protein